MINIFCYRFGLLPAIVALLMVTADGAERFQVWQASGKRSVSNQLVPLYQQSGDALQWGGNQFIGAPDDLPRMLQIGPAVAAPAYGSWVLFTNGDTLPARISGYLMASDDLSQGSLPARLELTLDPAAAPQFQKNTLQVRPECVASVYQGLPTRPYRITDTVQLTDGRELPIRAARFRPTGLECLTEKGIVNLPYEELRSAAWQLPAQAFTAVHDGMWVTKPGPLPRIARFTTQHGATLTAGNRVIARTKVREGYQNKEQLELQPNWSLQPVALVPDKLAGVNWREVHEVPAVTLPLKTLRDGARTWPLLLNRSVNGRELRVGELAAAQGWGLHAGTIITLQIPAGAQRFTAWTGVNYYVGKGGYARLIIRRDTDDGPELYRSEPLIGGAPAQRIDLDITDCRALVLEIDAAHDDRPVGADPWDIRDHIDLLEPLILMRDDPTSEPLRAAVRQPGPWLRALHGFQLVDDDTDVVRLGVYRTRDRFCWGLQPTNQDKQSPPVRYQRKLPVTLKNAHVTISAGGLDEGRKQQLQLSAGATPIEATMNGPLATNGNSAENGNFGSRVYSLANYLDQSIDLTMELVPDKNRDGTHEAITIPLVTLSPLVLDLDATGKPLIPDQQLTDLTPLNKPRDWTWTAGRTTNNQPLSLYELPFTNGTAWPVGQALSWNIDPRWSEFVAVVGLAQGWQGVGPYEILIDGQPHWKLDETFDRNSPARQVRVAIPAGGKTLTIKINGPGDSYGGLGNAGFILAK